MKHFLIITFSLFFLNYQVLFSQQLQVYSKGNYFGIQNEKGKKITDAIFVGYHASSDGHLMVISDQKIQLTNSKGKISYKFNLRNNKIKNLQSITFKFPDEYLIYIIDKKRFISELFEEVEIQKKYSDDKNQDNFIFSVKKDGKWGAIDANSHWMIRPQFENMITSGYTPFWYGAQVDDKYGFIDVNGQWIHEPIFDEIDYEHSDVSYVIIDEKIGYVNFLGQSIMDSTYDVLNDISKDYLQYKSSKKRGIIDWEGNELFAFYDDLNYISNDYLQFKSNEKRGIIDWEGNELFASEAYWNIEYIDEASLFKVQHRNGKWGLMDTNGNVVLSLMFDNITMLYPHVFVLVENGISRLINVKKSDYTIENVQRVEKITWQLPSLSLCHIQQSKKFGIINKDGTWIIPAHYDEKIKIDHPFLVGMRGGMWEVFDTLGTKVFSTSMPGISSLTALSSEYYSFRINNKAGILDKNNNIVINPTYDFIATPVNEYCKVKVGKFYGLIYANGTIAIPAKYEDVWVGKSGTCAVKIGDNWYILDKQYQPITKQSYSNLSTNSNLPRSPDEEMIVRIGSSPFYLDEQLRLRFLKF